MRRPENPEMATPAASRPGGVHRDARGSSGFTILEIMIATAILTLGLVGILALFPVAIHTGKQVVEMSTSAVIAESVAEAIREGIRNNLRYTTRGGASHAYFILNHDGVTNKIPSSIRRESPEEDYYILLPRYSTGAGRAGVFASRDDALKMAKTFVYPETDLNRNGGGNSFMADDDGDDYSRTLSNGEVVKQIRVDNTYKLGTFLPAEDAPDAINVLPDQKIEFLKQYSYAFSIQASREDANLSLNDKLYQPANRLYYVKVMVFRGFAPPASPEAAPPTPEFELHFEVSL